MKVAKAGILYHPMVEATRNKAGELHKVLDEQGLSVWTCSSWDAGQAGELVDGTDLLISLGGDGTILRSAQIALHHGTPIASINFGKLGFMTSMTVADAEENLKAILDGKGWIEERQMLQVDTGLETLHALNDVVVARGQIARVISIEARLGDKHMASYKADGVIAATPTGSTGYALSAGGPVVYPECRDFLLMPIVPHLSMPYPLLLPEESVVKLKVGTVHQAVLSIDGHINRDLADGSELIIQKSPRCTRFLRLGDKSYFYENLEEKLKVKR